MKTWSNPMKTWSNPMKTRHASLLAMLAIASFSALMPAGAQEGIAIPVPQVDQAISSGQQTAVLAGGCFWGVQGVFQHVEGVTSAISGYAGGEAATANYNTVVSGRTGHAESVKVTFDSAKISYGQILQIYFSVAHDPTQLNRQGPDRGTQYRSAIFPQNEEQALIAKTYIAQLNAERLYHAAIVTKIEGGQSFYPAESHHQDYMTKNPTQPYIAINDLPKVESLKRLFSERYRASPLLVSQTGLSLH